MTSPYPDNEREVSPPEEGLELDTPEPLPLGPDARGVFVVLPEDPALTEQREKMVATLDRAVYVLGIVGLVLLGLALITTVGGNPSWFVWLLPFIVFGGAGLCYFLLYRMELKPPNSIEVPAELGEDLTDAIAAAGEVEQRGAETMSDEEYGEVLAGVNSALLGATDAAKATLVAQRESNAELAEQKARETESEVDFILDKRDEVLQEYGEDEDEFFDDEYFEDEPLDDEYFDDEPLEEEAPPAPRRAPASRPAPRRVVTAEVEYEDDGQPESPPLTTHVEDEERSSSAAVRPRARMPYKRE